MPHRRDQMHRAQSRALPLVPPIYQSATFYLDDDSYADVRNGGLHEPWYSRFSNPTVSAAADVIREMEGGEAALMTSSGMGAIATTLLTLCGAGQRVVASRQVYGDTHDLLVRDLPSLGIRVDFVDGTDTAAWARALADGPVAVAYAEALSNPKLALLDVSAVAAAAHANSAALVVDNTFASPYVLQPLALGADVVIHSATKFLNGHSDVIAGAVVGRRDTVEAIQRRVITLGTSLDPHAAFLVWRGLQTFDVRMERQCATAAALAEALAGHRSVGRVYHPSCADYPQREAAQRLLSAGRAGAMLAVTLAGGDPAAAAALRALRVANEATSLGGVETLASAPFNSSHPSLTVDERAAAGIDDGLLRISVGLEPLDELLADLIGALDKAAATT
jgi:cystathionine beta-lyase/cystathionine gamma-synthase